MSKRLFFAIFPDPDTLALLQSVQQKQESVCKAKPVAPENLHLTLAFLGRCEEQQIPRIESIAEAIHIKPFTIQLRHYHVFNRRRILACVPLKLPPPLLSLHKRLLTELRSSGMHVRAGKRFTPHVSLFQKVESLSPAQTLPVRIDWRISSFSLVESTLRPDKAYYKVLRNYR